MNEIIAPQSFPEDTCGYEYLQVHNRVCLIKMHKMPIASSNCAQGSSYIVIFIHLKISKKKTDLVTHHIHHDIASLWKTPTNQASLNLK